MTPVDPTRENIRAYVIARFAPCYWPDDAQNFLRAGWERWDREKPDFYTPEWISKIPNELRPAKYRTAGLLGDALRQSWGEASSPVQAFEPDSRD